MEIRIVEARFADKTPACRRRRFHRFSLAPCDIANQTNAMKDYTKILFSILVAAVCTVSFAADKPNCSKTGKNCPMNDNKECNCGKSCDCGK
jgi:hypothetical protein